MATANSAATLANSAKITAGQANAAATALTTQVNALPRWWAGIGTTDYYGVLSFIIPPGTFTTVIGAFVTPVGSGDNEHTYIAQLVSQQQ